MQIFEVIELKEYPYMKTREILDGGTVSDILTEENEDKVFLIVDHDTKRILTYNGSISSLRLQIYGGILSNMLRAQLRLFYRVHPLNQHGKNEKVFTEIMEKALGPGKANPIETESFSDLSRPSSLSGDLSVHKGLKPQQALEFLNELPNLEDLRRKFLILGNNIYSDIETTKQFINEEQSTITQEKLGTLNRGFTLFEEENQAIRILIKNRIVQGIEVFITKDQHPNTLEVKVPIFYEQRFRRAGKIEDLMNAFQISEEWSDEE